MLNKKAFKFLKPGKLVSGSMELVLIKKKMGNPKKEIAPSYLFEMRLVDSKDRIGQIDLRIGNMEKIVKYGGHIGYSVEKSHRGNRYAAQSIKLLLPLARRHGLQIVWITCNPENLASRRTCEIAGGEFVEIVDLPKNSNLYLTGDRQKCRYKFITCL